MIATDDDLNTKKIKRNQFLKFENINVIYTSNFLINIQLVYYAGLFLKFSMLMLVHQNSLFFTKLTHYIVSVTNQ